MRTMRKPFGAKVAIVAALLCAVPVLAACGGSDSESAAAGGGSAGGSGGGDPIKIFVYGPFEAKGFSLPGLKTGPEAAVKKVNDAGGINGRKLELLSCNDGNDPNQAAGCARQAVQDKAVAVVGSLTTFEAQITPILERAGIPVVGINPLTDFTSKAYFPLSGGTASSVFGLAKALVANPKCDKKVGVVIEDFAATEGAAALVQLGVVASGGTFTGTSKAPQGARDFAPAVAAAAAKAGCLGFFSGPQTAPQIVTAMKQSGKVTVIGSIDSAVAPALAVLGKDADGIVVTTNFLPSTDSSPAVQDFVKGATAIDPKFRADQLSTSGYAGVLVLQKALTGVGDINAKTVTEAVSKVKGYDTGLGPIADFTTTNPAASFSRLPLNTPMFELVSRNGMFYRANDKTIDISAIYQAASKAGK